MEQDEELHLEQETAKSQEKVATEKVTTMPRKEAVKKLQDLASKGEDIAPAAEKHNITIWQWKQVQNKGWFGHLIEAVLGLERNNKQEPDFGDWELKTTSVYRKKNGEIVPKETVAITMIDKEHVIDNDFEHSHLYQKIKKIVLVSRVVTQKWDVTGRIYSVVELDCDEETLKIIGQDYEIVRQALSNHGDKDDGDLTCLRSEMGKYVQPRTKGEGNEEEDRDKSRAFYAKKELVAKWLGIPYTPPKPRKSRKSKKKS